MGHCHTFYQGLQEVTHHTPCRTVTLHLSLWTSLDSESLGLSDIYTKLHFVAILGMHAPTAIIVSLCDQERYPRMSVHARLYDTRSSQSIYRDREESRAEECYHAPGVTPSNSPPMVDHQEKGLRTENYSVDPPAVVTAIAPRAHCKRLRGPNLYYVGS